ncbi:hypothetical protein ASZ90_006198 [hydrocarbon metagenome]|uniref:Uncharacterized protein n=1 Tax=hydrocarbon metagenome TaxID=938273 RepID=A0A0W8FT83_9ZZZZ
MKTKMILGITLLFLVITAISANAADLCHSKADSAISNLKTWQDLRLWYENYHGCDDGYFAEGISDFVVASLAKQWQTLPTFQKEIMKNSRFKSFVMKHIDATTDDNDLKTTVQNAKVKCPSKLRHLCNEIGKNAQTALKAIEETTK